MRNEDTSPMPREGEPTDVCLGSRSDTLPLALDLACRRFESAWRAGNPLTIEQVLDEEGADDAERERLFPALLLLDLELRTAAGERPRPEDYLARFPSHARQVAFGFAQFWGRDYAPSSSSPEDCSDLQTTTRYRIVDIYAEGGLGRVLRAIDETLDRELAIKEIRAGRDDSTARARFAREATLTGRLEHPGIVPVHGIGVSRDGRPFYVMRLIRGESLRGAIARLHDSGGPLFAGSRSLELRELLRRFLDVCDAIAYAHSKGVIHRDLKPENIMLGPFGETLVVDWGLAKSFRSSGGSPGTDDASGVIAPAEGGSFGDLGFETLDRRVLGTLHYMSPEQARADFEQAGPASDIYSLGATFFDILTGLPPFAGSSDPRIVLHHVVAGNFDRPRSLEPKIPRPLEAICLKAMALRPEDRYATVDDLASDIRRWLADEPVSAWPEPWPVRARRWLRRHRTLGASLAGAFVVALAASVAVAWKMQRDEFEAQARAREQVSALISARAEALPGLIQGFGPDRARIVRRLRNMFHDPGLDPEGRLRVALALGASDRQVKAYLEERLLDADLVMLPLICQSLESVGRRLLVTRLWRMLEDDRTKGRQRLRAACALARFDPPLSPVDNQRWAGPASKIVDEALEAVIEDPHLFVVVSELLHPARRPLFAALAERFRNVPHGTFDPKRAELRAIAANLLDKYADSPDELSALIQDTLPGPRRGRFLKKLEATGEPAIAALGLALMQEGAVAGPKEPASPPEAHAQKKGRAAAALVELGRPEAVWPHFRQDHDPTVRTELIHTLPSLAADASIRAVSQRLLTETDPSARRALILCLGETAADQIAPEDRTVLLAKLREWYRHDPDPGIHGAIDWLLRRCWGEGEALDRIDRDLARPEIPTDRDWYVNAQGQTLAIIRGPVEFRMGSPAGEPGSGDDEALRLRWIDRSFAVGVREVTVAEYRQFLQEEGGADHEIDEPEFRRSMPTPETSVVGVNWFDAARYCNWLSRKEGIPRSSWCYLPPIGEGMTLDAGLLERTGYRLPTEAEWEYACRAGTTTSRPHGKGTAWNDRYGWFSADTNGHLHPVGQKKPNDLGIFDMLGNAAEWTLDRYQRVTTTSDGQPEPDVPPVETVKNVHSRVVRGGSAFLSAAPRSAARDWSLPVNRSSIHGFRVARTCPRQ